jgi:uncharacterized membrane protein YccC
VKLDPYSPPKQHAFRPKRESNRGRDTLLYRLSIGCAVLVVLGFLLSNIHPLFLTSVLAGVPGLGAGLPAYRQRHSGTLLVSNTVCGLACLNIPTVIQLLIPVLRAIVMS